MGDQLILENGQVTVVTEEGASDRYPGELFTEMLRGLLEPPLEGRALPDGTKFHKWQPPIFVLVHEFEHHVRCLRWIQRNSKVKFGPGTRYRKVRLSLPYAITFAVFYEHGGRLHLTGANELYFRNEPLGSKDDRLGYPALLNVSRIDTARRSKSWICTQYLRQPPGTDWHGQFHGLLEHIWNGGFNLSSEHHEGASWFGESKGIHKDLHPVERWQKATEADEHFALRVPWKTVEPTVGELIDAILDEQFRSLRRHSPEAGDDPSYVERFMNFTAQRKV